MSKKTKITNLPSPSVAGLSIYLTQIKKFAIIENALNPMNEA